MIAFTTNVALSVSKPSVGTTSFKTALPAHHESASSLTVAPTMVLRTMLRRPVGSGSVGSMGVFESISSKAEEYMAKSVRNQYLQMSNASGVYGLQCTEGSIKDMTEVARIRSLGRDFRVRGASVSKRTFDMFENRKNAIANSHECHHEERQFADYPKVAATYNVSKSEASGSCFRYASPETVEEASFLRYMDIQTKIAANPTGVYNVWCNEGTVKDQAEDIRVAALNTAFRQGQKSLIKLMDEKYQQKKQGYIAAHGCTYEEGLVTKYPSLGACFRSKSYGY